MTIQMIPTPIGSTQSGTADVTGASQYTSTLSMRLGNLICQCITTGFNTSDATYKVQHSLDNVNWNDVVNGSFAIASGTGSQMSDPITNISATYYRAVFLHGTNSAGTFVINFCFK